MALYEELQKHFNAAATKYPLHAPTFAEQLGIYKGALLKNDPLCLQILQAEKDSSDISCRPKEVIEVFKVARKIYEEQTGPKT